MTVNTKEFGKRDKLDVKTVFPKKGQNAAVVTVGRVQQMDVADKEAEGGVRKSIVINFREFPDHAFWPNNTGVLALVEVLGDEESDWVGERVPLILANTTNPTTGRPHKSVWVAAPEDWDDIVGKKRGRAAAKKATGRKATGKRGRKAR